MRSLKKFEKVLTVSTPDVTAVKVRGAKCASAKVKRRWKGARIVNKSLPLDEVLSPTNKRIENVSDSLERSNLPYGLDRDEAFRYEGSVLERLVGDEEKAAAHEQHKKSPLSQRAQKVSEPDSLVLVTMTNEPSTNQSTIGEMDTHSTKTPFNQNPPIRNKQDMTQQIVQSESSSVALAGGSMEYSQSITAPYKVEGRVSSPLFADGLHGAHGKRNRAAIPQDENLVDAVKKKAYLSPQKSEKFTSAYLRNTRSAKNCHSFDETLHGHEAFDQSVETQNLAAADGDYRQSHQSIAPDCASALLSVADNDIESKPAENTRSHRKNSDVDKSGRTPTSSEVGRTTVQHVLLELVRKIRIRADKFGFFSGPVDPVVAECPDYYEIIDRESEAMDLDTLEDMVHAGNLNTLIEFEACLNRIVYCAQKYNTDNTNFVRKQADLIEPLSRPLLDAARQKIKNLTDTTAVSINSGFTIAQNSVKQSPHVPSPRARRVLKRIDSDNRNNGQKVEKAKGYMPVTKKNDQENTQVLSSSDSSVSESTEVEYLSEDGEDNDDESLSEMSDDELESGRNEARRSTSTSKVRRSIRSASPVKADPVHQSRPSRRTRTKVINYSENDQQTWDSDIDSHSSERETLSTGQEQLVKTEKNSPEDVLRVPQSNAYEHYDNTEGSDIPQCRKDLATSVITPCSSREQWLASIPKLLVVCNEAARRATLKENPNAACYDKPLSGVYMKERLEYDKPLNGFVVRTKEEPCQIQGFIVTTNFNTWRKTFRWTIDTPAAGVTPTDRRTHATDNDGSLTSELQKVNRTGTNSRLGFTFDRVCEIALLGGLGCGGALLTRTLSELRQSKCYDYVVLQSTKMAIPFYERHGFIRVGAVVRFNDNEGMPEVAYRHWSEIVDGKAVEASYMMALRLNSHHSVQPPPVVASGSENTSKLLQRTNDIISALKAAHSLLIEALSIRATGSTAYSNSYRELIAAARNFAVSAKDYRMIRAIDRALTEFTGSAIGKSRIILRQELDLPKINKSLKPRSPFHRIKHEELFPTVAGDNSALSPQLKTIMGVGSSYCDRFVDAKVFVIINAQPINNEGCDYDSLYASVPSSVVEKISFARVRPRDNGWVKRDIAVYVVADGQAFTLKDLDHSSKSERSIPGSIQSLTAQLHMPPLCDNVEDVKMASSIALENLRAHLCSKPLDSTSLGNSPEVPTVVIGESIMINVECINGSPYWVLADVERRCRKYERPDDSRANDRNSYTVKFVEEGVTMFVPRVLDTWNRGVGREWCTQLDWTSFSVLPCNILDAMLLNSWVQYPASDGNLVGGFITRRIGGGLHFDPKWRLSTRSASIPRGEISSKPDWCVGEYEDLTAGALREAVTITNANLEHAKRVISEIDLRLQLRSSCTSSRNLSIEHSNSELTSVKSDCETDQAKLPTCSRRLNALKSCNGATEQTEASSIVLAPSAKENEDDAADKWARRRLHKYSLGAPLSNAQASDHILTRKIDDNVVTLSTKVGPINNETNGEIEHVSANVTLSPAKDESSKTAKSVIGTETATQESIILKTETRKNLSNSMEEATLSGDVYSATPKSKGSPLLTDKVKSTTKSVLEWPGLEAAAGLTLGFKNSIVPNLRRKKSRQKESAERDEIASRILRGSSVSKLVDRATPKKRDVKSKISERPTLTLQFIDSSSSNRTLRRTTPPRSAKRIIGDYPPKSNKKAIRIV